MPFVYHFNSRAGAQALDYLQTHTTPGTERDVLFLRPSADRALSLIALRVQGRGAGLTALSGITFRLKVYTTTASASTAGEALTPRPVDQNSPATSMTAGIASHASLAVTAGTGGPINVGSCGCGASGPGGWVASNPDAAITLNATTNRSVDLWASSGTADLRYDFGGEFQE